MTWKELRANPVRRDEHGVLVVLEEDRLRHPHGRLPARG